METGTPEILERLSALKGKKLTGYGSDEISESARNRVRAAAGVPEGDVFFLSGGTQTNAVVIDTMLRPYEGVIAAHTGHVSAHEAGAIEHGGHKVLEIPDGGRKSGQSRLQKPPMPIGRMKTMTIWSCRPWYIFPSPRNGVPSTA